MDYFLLHKNLSGKGFSAMQNLNFWLIVFGTLEIFVA